MNNYEAAENLPSPGSRVRSARRSLDLTIRELSHFTGLTPEAISMIENEANPPSLKSLRLLSGHLNVPISYLGCFEGLPEETLGDKIRKARLYYGLTLEEAAKKIDVDPRSIKNWETNKTAPSPRSINEIHLFISILQK